MWATDGRVFRGTVGCEWKGGLSLRGGWMGGLEGETCVRAEWL